MCIVSNGESSCFIWIESSRELESQSLLARISIELNECVWEISEDLRGDLLN
jgi:hypothetical protein